MDSLTYRCADCDQILESDNGACPNCNSVKKIAHLEIVEDYPNKPKEFINFMAESNLYDKDDPERIRHEYSEGIQMDQDHGEIYIRKDINRDENTEFSFEVLPKAHYDELVKQLRSSATATLNTEELSGLIHKKFGGVPFFVLTPKDFNIDIYRVRKIENRPINETRISEFWHAPLPNKMGRANIEGQQVFYGSLTPNGAIMEVQTGPGEYYLSRWNLKFTDPGSQIILVGFDGTEREGTGYFSKLFKEGLETYFSSLPEEHRERAIYKMIQYNEVFTTEGSEHYHLSSAISNTFFKLDHLNNMFVLSYPSVAKGKEDLNFALRGKFAEDPKYLTFESIMQLTITDFEKDGVNCNMSRKGVPINGEIVWHNLEREVFGSMLGNVTIEFSDGKIRKGINTETVNILGEPKPITLLDFLQTKVIPAALPELKKYSKIGNYLNDSSLMYKTSPEVTFGVNPESLFEFEGRETGIKFLHITIIYIDRFLPEQ